jgi:hypothetical protein
MGENTTVHFGENSQEKIAFDLLKVIAACENKAFFTRDLASGWTTADRNYILNTYAEILSTIKNPHSRVSDSDKSSERWK